MKPIITRTLGKSKIIHYWIWDLLNIKRLQRSIIKRLKRNISKTGNPIREDAEEYYGALISSLKSYREQCAVTSDALEPLHRAFSARGVRSRLFADEWWADFLDAASGFDEVNRAVQTRLIKYINDSDIRLCESWELLHIYVLCLKTGLLELGYSLRCKARERAIERLFTEKEPGADCLLSGVAALMENGRYPEIEERLQLSPPQLGAKKDVFSHMYHLFVPSNDANQIDKRFARFTEKDRAFGEIVKGRTVAVVGPAKSNKQDARSIDSYDLVVRINYRERGMGVDEKVKGLRCDITYMNDVNVRRFRRQNIADWPNEISWVVVKSRASAEEITANFIDVSHDSAIVNKRSKGLHIRVLYSVFSTLFSGIPNALPNVVLDLLRFDPAVIRVFHADLMLTVERTEGYSPKMWRYEAGRKKSFLDSISLGHDPVTQYWILHELWIRGRIEGDERFNAVMSLGEEEYMRALQKIYGNAGRIVSENQPSARNEG